MSKSNASDKICFVNFIFKSGRSDTVAVADSYQNFWEVFLSELCRDGMVQNKNIVTFDGIDRHVYVDMSNVAKVEISKNDKGQKRGQHERF